MISFNYMFYRISFLYKKYKIEENVPETYSGGLVTLCQTFDIIVMAYFVFRIRATIALFIVIGSILLLINWSFFFNEKKFKKLSDRYLIENKKIKLFFDICIVLYIIASIILYGIVAYLSKNG